MTFDHNINIACFEMVADIYVDGISNITDNIIVDITILRSNCSTMDLHIQNASKVGH